jgi:sec-independent protein translocase protein TatA
MPNIGPMELAIVLIIALVIFGPKKVPELGRSIGSGFKEFKSSISGEQPPPAPAKVESKVEAEA